MTNAGIFVFLLVCWTGFVISVQGDVNCDALGVNLYDNIGCDKEAPVNGCPSYDNCKYERPIEKCLYRGAILSDREPITGDILCNWHCVCTSDNDTKGEFICAQGQCGHWGQQMPENCYIEHDLDDCCGRKRCEPPTVTCDVEGKKYKEGEKIHAKNECWVCICNKDFNGKFEAPACKRRVCDAEIRNAKKIEDNCAPVYYKRADKEALCCPDTFVCPSSVDKITKVGDGNSERTCKYGDKTYSSDHIITRIVDQYGKKRNLTCKCELPPLFTCAAEY